MSIFCVWNATCILCDESSQQFSTERIKKATLLKPCDADSLFLDLSLLNIHYSWLETLWKCLSFISQDHFVNLFDLSAPKYQVYTPSSKLSRTTGSIRETWGKYTRAFPSQKMDIISSLVLALPWGFLSVGYAWAHLECVQVILVRCNNWQLKQWLWVTHLSLLVSPATLTQPCNHVYQHTGLSAMFSCMIGIIFRKSPGIEGRNRKSKQETKQSLIFFFSKLSTDRLIIFQLLKEAPLYHFFTDI